MKHSLTKIPFYPFIFALFPIVSLLSSNLEEMQADNAVRTTIVILAVMLFLLLIFRLVLRSTEKAAIFSSLTILLILSYGHLYHLLRSELPNGLMLIRHRYLLLVGGIGFLVFLIGIARSKWGFQTTTSTLNIISIGLIILPCIQISRAHFKRSYTSIDVIDEREAKCDLSPSLIGPIPDVYYIILDGYARQDVLLETYVYDNEPFLATLEELGFYIADGSQSNYAHTLISLTSSLNMTYHELHSPSISSDEKKDYKIPRGNLVRRELECLGFTSVALDNGKYWSNWEDADRFITVKEPDVNRLLRDNTNAFESMLIHNSAGLIALDVSTLISGNLRKNINYPAIEHQERVLFALNEVGSSVPKLPSPKVVYAHIITPHRPYFFGPNGEIIDPTGPFTLRDLNEDGNTRSEKEGYRNQVEGLNDKVLEMVIGILENSNIPPIIIIHADHGTGDTYEDHMSILMAIHLPDDGEKYLYETISPVNIFRMVFNIYFNGDYEILEDRSYYSHWKTRFDFTEIPNTYPEK